MNTERLIEQISNATGNEWDVGTEQNSALAARVTALVAVLNGTGAAARVRIVAWFIEDAMSIDADDALMELLEIIVAEHFK